MSLQHAPIGCRHETVEHVVASPWKDPPSARYSPDDTGLIQLSEGRQHAPSGKQVVSEHVVPSPI